MGLNNQDGFGRCVATLGWGFGEDCSMALITARSRGTYTTSPDLSPQFTVFVMLWEQT